ARAERDDEAVAPLAARQGLGAADEVGGELVVEREHDGALAREVPVEERRADVGPRGDVAERRVLEPALGEEVGRDTVEAIPHGGALRRGAPGTAAASAGSLGVPR